MPWMPGALYQWRNNMKPAAAHAADRAAYQKLYTVLRRKPSGLTVSDMCAATALPLSQVKELIPRAADEYSAQLKVTESGQIIYSFPNGFKSRYHGFGVTMARFFEKFIKGLGIVSSFLFKIWIMVMLIGYFLLFMALALGSIFLSLAGNSKNSNRRSGGGFVSYGLFRFIWRLWFYSEMADSMKGRSSRSFSGQQSRRASAGTRPLHKAIFSFVFGDDDVNKGADIACKKAIIAYVQSHKGIISMPEFMAISGKSPADAEPALLAFCVEYNGSPEASEDGTIVYRFEELLQRTQTQDRSFANLSPPIAGLNKFSGNTKTMNTWFGIINTVNLIFGSYFAICAIKTGAVIFTGESKIKSMYDFTYLLFGLLSSNPPLFIGIVLGLIPIVFSVLFWLIPAVRFHHMKRNNENIKLENLRRLGFNHIWSNPAAVKESDIQSQIDECKPKNMRAAQKRILKDMCLYSVPEIIADDSGTMQYSFNELVREKDALEKCRAAVRSESSQLGSVVFDSGE